MEKTNRSLVASEVLEKLPAEVLNRAYLVGCWVWVGFDIKPGPEIIALLKELGFHWNQKRKVWQHSGGFPTRHAPYDPRLKYGIREVSQIPALNELVE